MALFIQTTGPIIEVQTTGNDSYGGVFCPANGNFSTNGVLGSANTASPTFSSASYTFIARDVGHWLFLKAGTNLNPCWAQIASVSGGVATLSAAIGTCPKYNSNCLGLDGSLNTITGVSASASLTNITWGVDYSQNTPISFTDLVMDGSGSISSAATPLGVNFIGNIISITGGTGWTAGAQRELYNIRTATTMYPYGTGATLGSTGGTGYIGGPLLTHGKAATIELSNTVVQTKSGTYALTSNTSNASGGIISSSQSGDSNTRICGWFGYGTYRGDNGTAPVIQATGVVASNFLMSWSGNYKWLHNMTFDCNNQTGMSGMYALPYQGKFSRVCIKNAKNYGMRLATNSYSTLTDCWMTNITSTAFSIEGSYNNLLNCEVYDSAGMAFNLGTGVHCQNCIAANVTNYGFSVGNACTLKNCVAYACTTGFLLNNGTNNHCENCHAEGCSSYGWGINSGSQPSLKNCSGYNNTSGNYQNTLFGSRVSGFITITAGSVFTNTASKDFSLNSTTGRGALLRAAGHPGTMYSGYFTAYPDIGVAQHQDAGGGSTYIINKKTNIYIGEDYGS